MTPYFKARHYSKLSISETIQDRHVVTTDNKVLLYGPLNCAIANDLEDLHGYFNYFTPKISLAYTFAVSDRNSWQSNKNDIADDLECPLKVISSTINSFIVCVL